MFYSHEVLTSRKYGIATVWLVATLGSKSGLKKVSRKAILDVDVQKACETIVTPQAPMALRLQSNLLYGVTRVYAQQCGYVLSDVESAKNHMRFMFKVLKASALDAEGGNQARAEQLMLQDDPNFYPDLDLAPFDLDMMNLDMMTVDGSQGSTLSPHNSQLAGVGIGSPEDVGGLIIPPSASSFLGGPVGGVGGISVRGDSGAGSRAERQGFLDDDLGLIIDEEGNVQMTDAPPRQPRGPSAREESTGYGGGGSGVGFGSGGVRDGQEAFGGRADDEMYMPLQDDLILPMDDQDMFQAGQPQAVQQHVTSEETTAPAQRKQRKAKPINMDSNVELRNNDLARWVHNYVSIMQDAIQQKEASKAMAIAKNNAEFWVLGRRDEGPLSKFSGAKLLEALTGVKLGHAGEKRPREEDDTDTDRRVRSHRDPSSDEIGRGFDDDGFNPIFDDTIEQGREAPTPLDERYLSSLMPWNQSVGSQRRTGLYMPTSASLGGGGGPLGPVSRRGSRLTSASPMVGRGIAGGAGDEFQLTGSEIYAGLEGLDDVDLFGPAAGVNTQTANDSQWLRTVLDGESMHFLEFVQAEIQEIDETRAQAAEGDEDDESLQGSIDFDVLLPPDTHSCIVAAQGLLHVLALGTKNLLKVEQDEAFGPITLRAMAGV